MQQDSLETCVTQQSGHAFTPSFWISVIFQLRDMINRSSSYKHLTGHPEGIEPVLENSMRSNDEESNSWTLEFLQKTPQPSEPWL